LDLEEKEKKLSQREGLINKKEKELSSEEIKLNEERKKHKQERAEEQRKFNEEKKLQAEEKTKFEQDKKTFELWKKDQTEKLTKPQTITTFRYSVDVTPDKARPECFKQLFPADLTVKCPICFNRTIKFDKWEFEAAHIIAESKGGPYAIWNLVPSCRVCNGDCKTQNLVDYIGTQNLPINQINLKYLMTKLMINWEPSLKTQLKSTTLVEWVKDVYKPSHIEKYEKVLSLSSSDIEKLSANWHDLTMENLRKLL